MEQDHSHPIPLQYDRRQEPPLVDHTEGYEPVWCNYNIFAIVQNRSCQGRQKVLQSN